MADDDLMLMVGLFVGATVLAGVILGGWRAFEAYLEGRFSRVWRWLRVCALGGVTTLKQALAYDCGLCRRSLDRREKVRTLSCDHVFHFRKSDKCGNNIDDWLRDNRLRCPTCCRTAHRVSPWKAPPTSAPPPARSPSTSDLDDQEPLLSELEEEPPVHLPSQWSEDTLLSPSLSPPQ